MLDRLLRTDAVRPDGFDGGFWRITILPVGREGANASSWKSGVVSGDDDDGHMYQARGLPGKPIMR
jgi:hypothetical protein